LTDKLVVAARKLSVSNYLPVARRHYFATEFLMHSLPRLQARESTVLCLLVIASIALPTFFAEPLPFSRFPMYSSSPHYINLVSLNGEGGEVLDVASYGLRLELHPWAPKAAGMPLPATLNPTNRPLRVEEVKEIVALRSQDRSLSQPKSGRLRVIGPKPDGSFGQVSETAFDF
jgi:hypothetical protein